MDLRNETGRYSLLKILLLVFLIVVYFLWCARQYGSGSGALVTLLTWSFFVLCTPIADAGFLLDFPIRLLTRLRMVWSEIGVWVIAIGINIFAISLRPELYGHTLILQLFYKILTHPFPYWAIIVLSGFGTFLSIRFGDELVDVSTHRERRLYQKHVVKHRFIIFMFVIAFILALYYFVLETLQIDTAIL